MIDALVADANPLLSSLLGGQARDVLFCDRIAFFACQHTLFEVEKYLPCVARKIRRAELGLFREFQLLPVVAVQPREYDPQMDRAMHLIGQRDPKDVHVLSLALQRHLPIWTEDRDFDGLPGVTVYRTSELLALIDSQRT